MVAELMKGLSITLSHFFKKPVTLKYPDVKMTMYPRFRGLHELHRYENGLERCVCCGLCAAVCPADAIYMEAADNTPTLRLSAGERYAKPDEVGMLRGRGRSPPDRHRECPAPRRPGGTAARRRDADPSRISDRPRGGARPRRPLPFRRGDAPRALGGAGRRHARPHRAPAPHPARRR